MSEPLDPVAAGVASLLKSLRTRAGLQQERLSGTELQLDPLTGLDRVRAFTAAGEPPEQAIVQAVREAASSLPPTLMIVADMSLSLELFREALPEAAELYAPDLGRRRQALLANWDRLHQLRSVAAPAPVPSPRALRLDVETEALGALAVTLTETARPLGTGATGTARPGRQAAQPAGQAAPLPAAEKRVFGTELRKTLRSRRLTAADVARALDLSPAEIGLWESGKDFPSHEKAQALDDYLTARGAIHSLAEELRSKAIRATHGATPPRLAAGAALTLLQVFDHVAHTLRDSLTRDADGTPQGWPRDLRQLGDRATHLSTAFGLRAMLLLEGSLAADLVPVAIWLREGASRTGGYAALTQSEPRPEVTATVLQTLHRIDGTTSLCAQLDTMKNNIGDFERTRPYILTTLLEASHELDPDSELTATLVRDLLDARRPYGDLLLWPEKVEPLLVSPAPSAAHTARAVAALAQIERPAPEVRAALEQAAVWLAGQRNLQNVSENIDRPLDSGGMEQLYTRHFTAAWVVKALVSVGLPASHPAVSTAVSGIWSSYSETAAVWNWDNGDLPIWLTFDAIDALRLAALAGTIRRGRSPAL
jgi:transcriptional regulator with XRE-family HTH domain